MGDAVSRAPQRERNMLAVSEALAKEGSLTTGKVR
jgi:hypothetical protein